MCVPIFSQVEGVLFIGIGQRCEHDPQRDEVVGVNISVKHGINFAHASVAEFLWCSFLGFLWSVPDSISKIIP